MELYKSKIISLKSSPTLTERWLQDEIVKDPLILGLGEVIVRSQERNQPKGGPCQYEVTQRGSIVLVCPTSSHKLKLVDWGNGATCFKPG